MNWYIAVLKNYVGFSGRARRQEYWMFALVDFIIFAVLYVIGLAIKTEIPYLIYGLAVLLHRGRAARRTQLEDYFPSGRAASEGVSA